MNTPLISIIIPVYNVELYLRTCLDSIINQTYKNIEILCVNDGSSDNSLNILKEYANKDNRIKIFDIKNHGVSYARNLALDNVSGEYLMFVDSDDYIGLSICEDCINNALRTNSDLVCCGRKIETKDGRIKRSWVPTSSLSKDPVKDFEHFTLYRMITQKLFKTSLIQENNLKFDLSLNLGEDSLFFMEYLTKCKLITGIKKVLYTNIINPTSLTRNPALDKRRKAEQKIALKKISDVIAAYKVSRVNNKPKKKNKYF